MQPQIHEKTNWKLIGRYQSRWVPEDIDLDEPVKRTRKDCYGANWTEPGYIDQTDWTICEKVSECVEYLYQSLGGFRDDKPNEFEKIDHLVEILLKDSEYLVAEAEVKLDTSHVKMWATIRDNNSYQEQSLFKHKTDAYIHALKKTEKNLQKIW